MKNKSSLVISILLLALGAWCFYYSIGLVQSNSADWPSVQGSVISSRVNSSSSNDEIEYFVDVTYGYNIGGTDYSSTLSTPGQTTESDAQHDMRAYRPGSQITVYYNPKDPAISTTSPGSMELTGVGGLLTGLFFLGTGGWGIRGYFVPAKTKPAVANNLPI